MFHVWMDLKIRDKHSLYPQDGLKSDFKKLFSFLF